MRKFTEPHMLFHVLLVVVGVVLLLIGYAAGLYLIACAVMMWVMMGAMGGHGSDRSGGRPSGREHH